MEYNSVMKQQGLISFNCRGVVLNIMDQKSLKLYYSEIILFQKYIMFSRTFLIVFIENGSFDLGFQTSMTLIKDI